MKRLLEEEIIDEIIRTGTRTGLCTCFTLASPWPAWVPELARRSPDEALRLLGSSWGGLAPGHAEEHLKLLGLNTDGGACGRGARWRRSGKPAADQVFVIRGRGERGSGSTWLSAEFLAPGDLILLSEGETVPADLRLLRVHELSVDEASLTGASRPIPKTPDWTGGGEDVDPRTIPDLCFGGTRIVSGTATALVVATGHRTLGALLRAS